MAYDDDFNQTDDRKQPLPAAKPLTEAEAASLAEQFFVQGEDGKKKNWTPQQINRIYRDMGGWCGADDLAKFLYICGKRNLDPLLGEVHAEFRWNRKSSMYSLAPIIHIDGARKLADVTTTYDGQDAPVFEVDSKGNLLSAMVRVYRKDCAHPFEATCFLAEFTTNYGNWKKMPHVMLAKCAEMAALRKAFPAALAGVYIREEFDRTDGDDTPADTTTTTTTEQFTVGRKANGVPAPPPVEAPAPAPQAAPPPAPDPIDANSLQGKTTKRLTEVRANIQIAGRVDGNAAKTAVNAFMRAFLGVTSLPKDPESYQAPLDALGRLQVDQIPDLILNPAKIAKAAREPLEQAFDSWKWTIACTLAKGFIRSKAMTDQEFIEWSEMTGASALNSPDAASFLALALVTNKAYMILNLDRQGQSVADLVARLDIKIIQNMKPEEVAAAIEALGPVLTS